MSVITARVLYKGLGMYESKKKTDERTGKPVQYHSANFFGTDGTPADFKADIDMENGGKQLHEKLQKLSPVMVDVKMDLSFYQNQARFKLLSCDPVK